MGRLVDILLFPFKSKSEKIGMHGEKLTENELKFVRFFGRKGKILKNIYVPKRDGKTSEIDFLYITKKGILVIESKNYSGWIYGDEISTYWTALLPNGQKNKFYNPVFQNDSHIKWLKKLLNHAGFVDVPLFSLIVFSERCELKRIEIESRQVKVIKRDKIYANVRDIWRSDRNALSEDNIEEIYEFLEPYGNVSRKTKREHVKEIKKQYYKKENQKICPWCGSKLVLRTVKQGEHVGRRFYGCSNFPNCRYTRHL